MVKDEMTKRSINSKTGVNSEIGSGPKITKISAEGNIEMKNLIPIVNELYEVCREMGIPSTEMFDLPQIAVVGAQSAGKSSVLENIVGRDFLPRGNGIVTRRPLILKLITDPNGKEYGEFDHLKGDKYKRFENYDDIRDEIEKDTDLVTGTNKGISKEPISLSIHSPNVLDLTLIDLPGLTKVPVGDQPIDIEKQIREMIFDFIRMPNCLILAVSPANYDLANSDALNMAKEVDEDGLRTIGVITKLDLMDAGTNARDIFMGKLLKLRRGYIGVVNRSQKDIEDKKNIAVTLKAEHDFFRSHDAYKDIADRLGTPYLQKVLSKQLNEHISKHLKTVQARTEEKMEATKKEIDLFESLYPAELSSKTEIVINAIQQIQNKFDMEMGSLGSIDVYIDRLCCGANIRRIFDEQLPVKIANVLHEGDKMCQEIANAIDNAYGYRGIMNTPSITLVSHIKKQIESLRAPIEKCIVLVGEELKEAVRKSTEDVSSYPKFRDNIERDIMSNLRTSLSTNQKNVLLIVEMQKAYVNSSYFAVKNQDGDIIREGLLNHNKKEGKEHRFILKKKELMCCDVEDGTVTFIVKLDEVNSQVKFKIIKDDTTNETKIVLIRLATNQYEVVPIPLYQNESSLTLASKNNKMVDIRLWIKSFSQVIKLDGINQVDPLQEKVDTAYEDISQYMNIVKKNICDMTPKAITHFIIQSLEKFIKTDLLIKYGTSDNMLSLFDANDDEFQKYQDNQNLFQACEKALEVLAKNTARL